MRNIKKIFIVVFSLILLFAVSCSNDDKTGVANNPPEDTEITDGETGSGGTGGSEEGDGGTETPPTPSEPETPPSEPEILTTEIYEEGFPPELLGTYRDERIYNMYKNSYREEDDAKVSLSGVGIRMKGTQMRHKKDGSADGTQSMDERIKKWNKTTKGGKIIKLEGESLYTRLNEKNEKITVAKTVIIFDYENKTVSMTFTTYTPDGVDASFYGKKID